MLYKYGEPNSQTIATFQRNKLRRCWTQHVARVWLPCCDMLGVAGARLKMVKFEPTTPNMSQHGGQTHATCCVQQCCDMLRLGVATVSLGLNVRCSQAKSVSRHHMSE